MGTPRAAGDLSSHLDALLARYSVPIASSGLIRATARLVEAPPDRRERELVETLASLGLRVAPVRTTAQAMTTEPATGPYVAVLDGTIVLIERAARGRARVISWDDGRPTQLGAKELAQRLGAQSMHHEVRVHTIEDDAPLRAVRGHPEHDPVARTLALLSAERADVAAVLVYAVAVGLLALVTPIAAQALVTNVAFATLLQPIVLLGVVVLVCLGASTLMRALSLRVVEHVQRRIFVRVVADLARRLPRAHASVLEGGEATELVNRFFDVFALQKSLASLLVSGVESTLTLMLGLVLLAVYAPVLLGFDIVLLGGIAFVVFVLGRGGVQRAIEESKAKYAVAAWLEEVARHPTAFKGDGGPSYAQERANALARRYLEARESHFRITFGQTTGALVIQAMAVATLLGVGGYLVTMGTLSLGALVAAEIVVAMIASTLVKVGKHLEDFYDLVASVDKLAHLVDIDLEREDGERARHELGPVSVEVSAAKLSDTSCVDLRVEPGERVALLTEDAHALEASSRLADVLFGTASVTAGVTRVDGAHLQDLDLTSIRERVALVRRAETFPGTVRDNVTLGRRRGSIDAREALDRVALTDALATRGVGLGTLIDFGGRPLSPSEAIRLSIARALYGDPGLLVLDGALDRLGEPARHATMDALFSAARTTTFVVITRDPAVAARCDRTVKVEMPAPAAEANDA